MLKVGDWCLSAAYREMEGDNAPTWEDALKAAEDGCSDVVYGLCGIHRYFVSDGTVVFSMFHAYDVEAAYKAQRLGFVVDWSGSGLTGQRRGNWREAVRYHWDVSTFAADLMDEAAELIPFPVRLREDRRVLLADWLNALVAAGLVTGSERAKIRGSIGPNL